MNYISVSIGNQTEKNTSPQETNGNTGTQDNVNAGKEVSDQHYTVLPLWSSISSTYKSSDDKPADDTPKDVTADALRKEFEQGCMDQRGVTQAGSTNSFNTVCNPVNAASTSGTFNAGGPSSPHPDAFIPANTLLHFDQDDSETPNLEETVELQSTGIFNSAYDDDLDIYTSPIQSVGAEADFNNMESFTIVILIPTHKDLLDFASFMEFNVYQMDVKSAFLYGTIEEEVYVSQPPGFIPRFPNKVYKYLCDEFEALMHKSFQLSSIGELTFFLGLLVKKSEEGIFISQDKYVAEILKKLVFSSVKIDSTPIETQKPLVKDEVAADVDVNLYRSMIGSLMYLMASRPDIMFAVCACSRFQFTPKLSHLQAVKRIFRRCKKQIIVTTSTTEAEYVADAHCCGQTEENVEFHQIVDFLSTCSINYALTAVVITESSVRSDLLFNDEDGGSDSVERAITIDASLVAAQDNDNIAKTQSMIMSIDPIFQEIDSGHIVGSGEDRMEQESNLTNFVPPTPHDSPLSGGHTLGSDEGRPNLLELMNICTKLSNMILSLQESKTTQEKVITRLKLRVRRLEKKRKSRTSQPMKKRLFKGRVKTSTDKSLGEDASKQGRNDDQIEDLNLTNGVDTEVILEDKGSGEKEEKKLVEPESKDKKGKRIKRVVDSASKQKSFEKQKMMQEQESTKSDEEELEDYEQENKELRMWLTVVLDEEEIVDLKILSTKYPIVDWESQILWNVDMEDKHVYKIIRANGNTNYHKSLSSMMRKFDKQDLVDFHRLVMKRFDNSPEGYNFLLWGYLKNSYIADGWYFELLQHVSREKVSSHQGNAGEDVELEAELRVLWHLSFSSLSSHR
nr:retrotransposon protein, putative, Ty1-copia subclass [Tanacetum cinerariifolium]